MLNQQTSEGRRRIGQDGNRRPGWRENGRETTVPSVARRGVVIFLQRARRGVDDSAVRAIGGEGCVRVSVRRMVGAGETHTPSKGKRRRGLFAAAACFYTVHPTAAAAAAASRDSHVSDSLLQWSQPRVAAEFEEYHQGKGERSGPGIRNSGDFTQVASQARSTGVSHTLSSKPVSEAEAATGANP